MVSTALATGQCLSHEPQREHDQGGDRLASRADVKNKIVELASHGLPDGSRLGRAVYHHLGGSGRLVRARLALSCGGTLQVERADRIAIAATCELLHTASLVHDDLQDRDPERRGRPAVWAAFDDDTALLTGDYFLSLAYRALADVRAAADPAALFRLTHRRTSEAILGQSTDLEATSNDLSAYEDMVVRKSGALLSLPLELPLLASGLEAALPAAHEAARSFALGYQVIDDLKDAEQPSMRGTNILAVLIPEHGAQRARRLANVLARQALAEAAESASAMPHGSGALLVSYAHNLLETLERSTIPPVAA